jgi:septum formation protein
LTRFLLASGSPRRRELFGLFGWPFEIASADVDETPHPDETPAQMVERLAQVKALAVAERTADTIVAAADTTVALDGLPMGKPLDAADAARMLRALRGRTHQVHTAVALINTHTGQRLSDLATTDVPMRNYTDAEMTAYISSGDPLDKAGAYAIQHEGFHPVTDLHGCFANVMGLPLCHLARTLCVMSNQPQVDVPTVCQAHLKYECPVFADILNQAPREAVNHLSDDRFA